MLGRSGLATVAAGNIGTALSDVAGGAWDVVVVEVSSFQLRFTERFRPEVAVLLNVAPDHLDWHGSIHAYAAAKARIFANQGPEQVLVYDADDPGAAALVEIGGARLVPACGRRHPNGGVGVEHGSSPSTGSRCRSPPWSVGDPAYLLDIAAAGAAALAAGATTDAIAAASCDFRPRRTAGRWWGRGTGSPGWTIPRRPTPMPPWRHSMPTRPSSSSPAAGAKGLTSPPSPPSPSAQAGGDRRGGAGALGRQPTRDRGLGGRHGGGGAARRRGRCPRRRSAVGPGWCQLRHVRVYAHRGEVFADEVRRHSEADHTRQSGRDR